MAKANNVLVEAIAALTDKQKARLQAHLDNKTPIACGDSASQIFTVDGGAALFVLASTIKLTGDSDSVQNFNACPKSWQAVYKRLANNAGYFDAVEQADQATVRQSIRVALRKKSEKIPIKATKKKVSK